jgi:transcriptional regulator with XRE-family HTH domain
VIGLRREEAALLAGLSVDYYTRLERGNLKGASESVLHALAGGLQLGEAERAYLFDLARGEPVGQQTATPGGLRHSASQKVRARCAAGAGRHHRRTRVGA